MSGSVSSPVNFWDWEITPGFAPLSVVHNQEAWVRHNGSTLSCGPLLPTPNNQHLPSCFVSSVSKGLNCGDISMLVFRGPSTFVAGALHSDGLPSWYAMVGPNPSDSAREVLDWLSNKVDVHNYFRHFKGKFKVEFFDSDLPPASVFYNHLSCRPFKEFVYIIFVIPLLFCTCLISMDV